MSPRTKPANDPRRLKSRVAEERGEAAILSGLLLLAGVLIPLMFLIPLFARVELAQVDAQQAARRGLVWSPSNGPRI
jgi:hypothetical protein